MATDFERAYKREKTARHEAEELLENKTRELFLANQSLQNQYKTLQQYAVEIELFFSIAKFAQEEISFEKAFKFYIDSVCKLSAWPLGHVYVPSNEKPEELVSSNVWHIENPAQYLDFQTSTNKSIFKINSGIPGIVYGSGQSLWLDDISLQGNLPLHLPRFTSLIKYNIKSAFAVPIKCYGKVIAVAEFFTIISHQKDARLLELVSSAAIQLGALLERHQAELDAKENYQKLLEAQIELKHLAHHDSLTNLPNRLQFELTFKREIARAERTQDSLALLFIDLDYFKTVNDGFGHDIGDLLLKEVADRLQKNIRAGDFVARLGGDEFAVILTHFASEQDAVKIADKLIENLNTPYKVAGHDIGIGASIGIAYYPDAGTEHIQLVKSADIAMYNAKANGRNTYQLFSNQMQHVHSERLDFEHALRFALERNELFLVYQPKYNLNNKLIIGAEVLLRWKHPTFGLVSPDKFIPIAEETGLILNIGKWVLQTACRQYAKWRTELKDVNYMLAINISPHQLRMPNFVDFLKQLLQETNIPTHLLEFEITETAAMIQAENTTEVLEQIHALGVHISIDDFGTGYSTLSRLKQLPISTIKIDKSFIQDINNSPNDALIVKSAISLAQGLGLNVIAEGVETESQLDFLRKNHCPQVQGYYYSKPLDAKEFVALFTRKEH